MKRLQPKGLGSTRRQDEPITINKEELLWNKKVLGDYSPEAPLNTHIHERALLCPMKWQRTLELALCSMPNQVDQK